jgi:hypothetical protein
LFRFLIFFFGKVDGLQETNAVIIRRSLERIELNFVDLINHFILANVYSARKKELKNKQKEEERRRKEEEKAKQVLAFMEFSFGSWENEGL